MPKPTRSETDRLVAEAAAGVPAMRMRTDDGVQLLLDQAAATAYPTRRDTGRAFDLSLAAAEAQRIGWAAG